MGAAIPHLMQLTVSLPEVLPHSPEDIHTEVLTGTAELQDEVIPDDEDEDISYRTRGKSTVSVVITIGDGVDEGARSGKGRKGGNKSVTKAAGARYGGGREKRPQQRNQGGKDSEKQLPTDRGQPERVVVRVEDLEG